MFSVNIDKLIAASDEQNSAYKELSDNLLLKGRKYKSIALIGANGYALRLAAIMADAGNKVLFMDADLTSAVFMGKYRLGKNLEGLSEYLDGAQDFNKITCLTNNPNLRIVFSGESVRPHLTEMEERKIRKLLEDNESEYDYIILEAGKSIEVARNCLASVALIDSSEYSIETARSVVEKYDSEGCLVLGVAVVNV